MLSADSETAVVEVIIELIADRVDAHRYLFARRTEEGFTIDAQLPAGSRVSPGQPSVPEDLIGQCYSMRQSCVVDDRFDIRGASETRSESASDNRFRSLVFVPVADLGVFVIAAKQAGALNERHLDTVEEIVSLGESALNHLKKEPELLEEVADILSHDVQSPLQVAIGRIEMAKANNELEHLRKIDRALTRLQELLDSVVKLIRTGDRVRSTKRIDLEDAVAKVRSVLEMQNAELIVEESTVIRADENCLLEILENLFRNAVHHAGPDVRVTVGVLEDGFFVEDDGPGISPDHRTAVFDLGVTTSTEHTGIGLSIVERLVSAHGWEIEITDGTNGGVRLEITGVEVSQ